jgi:hypothetical protein
MADNMQLPSPGGPAGYTAVGAQPVGQPSRALLTAVLFVIAGALLGLVAGAIWAAAAPRVVYQVYSLNPPTAFAINPETDAFIAADGIYTFIALGGGALLGLAGYIFGVRRYGPLPLAGVVLGSLAAAFLARWLGPQLTGSGTFNNLLGSSKPGALLHAPIALGAQGALAFWPVAAALVAGGLELMIGRRARHQRGNAGGRPAGLPGLLGTRPGAGLAGPLTGYQPPPGPGHADGYQQRAADPAGPPPGVTGRRDADDQVPPGVTGRRDADDQVPPGPGS